MMRKLTPKQQDVWNAIVNYVDGVRPYRFYTVAADPLRPDSGICIAPIYGENISHTTLKALEREGLISLSREDSNLFQLTSVGAQVIEGSGQS